MGEREATCILSRLPPYGTHTGVDAQQSGDGALNFAAAFGKSTLDRQVGFVIHARLATPTDSQINDAGQTSSERCRTSWSIVPNRMRHVGQPVATTKPVEDVGALSLNVESVCRSSSR